MKTAEGREALRRSITSVIPELYRDGLAEFGLGDFRLAETDVAVVHEAFDPVAFGEAAEEDLLGERVLDEPLHRPAQGSRAVVRVVTLGGQQFLDTLVYPQRE